MLSTNSNLKRSAPHPPKNFVVHIQLISHQILEFGLGLEADYIKMK